jgi:hypothetical protein
LTAPGVSSATRYKAIDAEKPDWLATYDLATTETTNSPAYLGLRDKASDNEKALIPRLTICQRRIYSLVAHSTKPGLPEGALPGKYLLVVLWSVPEELDTEFHKWYDEEHTSEISKVPGWLRGRRYKIVDGADLVERKGPQISGWNYLVMHDWDNGDYKEAREFITAIETKWSQKIIGSVKGVQMRHFELYKDF